MQKVLMTGLAIFGCVIATDLASAKTEKYASVSPNTLRGDCDLLGGTFGEVKDSKTGAHYYWCKQGDGSTIKCVDNNCTKTTPLARVPTIGTAVNSRNPGSTAPSSQAAGSTKLGAPTSGASGKVGASISPSSPTLPNTANVGMPKPVTILGPVSNNNRRQQQ